MQGTLAKVVEDKKIGFIKQEGVEKDMFFNENKLDGIKFDDLKVGDALTFDIEETDDKKSIVKVKKA